MFSTTEAEAKRIEDRLLTPESIMEELMKTATIIMPRGRVALRAAKQSIDQGTNKDLRTGIAIEINNFALAQRVRMPKKI